ncbi:hypothetical protein [Massilia oculi]|uniref:hypothetical protein n=1 Tax=Massilia oculi TaxID=945844 RepID=UPI001AAEFE0A|nr:hypothetical protein [Massilia oculi]
MRTQRLSTWLALRCREPLFQRFLRVPDEQTAVRSVRAICEVKSRGEIDRNPTAAQRFHDFIRKPYLVFALDPKNHIQEN